MWEEFDNKKMKKQSKKKISKKKYVRLHLYRAFIYRNKINWKMNLPSALLSTSFDGV